jgi:hypothetical protein
LSCLVSSTAMWFSMVSVPPAFRVLNPRFGERFWMSPQAQIDDRIDP